MNVLLGEMLSSINFCMDDDKNKIALCFNTYVITGTYCMCFTLYISTAIGVLSEQEE